MVISLRAVDIFHVCPKTLEMVKNYPEALQIDVHIGNKSSGFQLEKKYYVVQFGDVLFYDFLKQIGLMPNKSKVMGKVDIPTEYFFRFSKSHLLMAMDVLIYILIHDGNRASCSIQFSLQVVWNI